MDRRIEHTASESTSRLTVVVSTYEWPEALDAVLRGLESQSDSAFEIVVADDGSGNSTEAVVEDWKHRFGGRLVHAWQDDDGVRLARIRNIGAATARGAGLVFIDGDCIPRRDFVRAIRRALLPGWFLAGTRLELDRSLSSSVLHNELPIGTWSSVALFARGARRVRGWRNLTPRDRRRSWRPRLPDFAPRGKTYGFCTAVSRADFEAVNGFDMTFVGWGDEDVDLAVRLRRLGLRCGYAGPHSAMLHLWHPSNVPADRPTWHLLQETIASDRVQAVSGMRELRHEFELAGADVISEDLRAPGARCQLRQPALGLACRAGVERGAALNRLVTSPAVSLVGVYRRQNASFVAPLVSSAVGRGWKVAWWALDEPVDQLAHVTVGVGHGSRLALLNETLERARATGSWVVVSDDDLVFTRGGLVQLVDLCRTARLDLAQPARSDDNSLYPYNVAHPITMARRLSRARTTTFVEIGPLFVVGPRWQEEILPFPAERGMGWGLELDWFELHRRGCRLGIVDAVHVAHVGQPGGNYDFAGEADRVHRELAERGFDGWRDVQRTLAVWRPWRRTPPWLAKHGGDYTGD